MDKSRVVLITGGTRGIGLETAKIFLRNGDKVVAASIDEKDMVEAAMEELKALGEATYLKLNVAEEKSCKKAVEETVAKYGRIDVLCNIAGIVGELKTPLDADMQKTAEVIQVDLLGTICMSVYAGRVMREQGKGVIINTSSICGFMATNVSVGYHAAKAGMGKQCIFIPGSCRFE